MSFDFGPRPVLGAMADPSAAASAAWGGAISSIGSQVGGYLGRFSRKDGNTYYNGQQVGS